MLRVGVHPLRAAPLGLAGPARREALSLAPDLPVPLVEAAYEAGVLELRFERAVAYEVRPCREGRRVVVALERPAPAGRPPAAAPAPAGSAREAAPLAPAARESAPPPPSEAPAPPAAPALPRGTLALQLRADREPAGPRGAGGGAP